VSQSRINTVIKKKEIITQRIRLNKYLIKIEVKKKKKKTVKKNNK